MLSIENLKIGYRAKSNDNILLENINLSVDAGEFISLVGKNGIGKSTLLRTLVGLQDALSGEILLNQKSVTSYTIQELSKKICYVSTEHVQIPNLTVFDFVSYARAPYNNWYGKLSNDDKKAITESLELTNSQAIAHRIYDELSDGEKQRVLISRALAQDTEIIVLDEPTAFLDLANKYEIFHLLSQLSRQKNKTIIFSTHDLNIAINESDKIWLIHDKNIIEGMPEELVLNNVFNKLFDSSNLVFEKEVGEFIRSRKNEQIIGLQGNGIEFIWTKKALLRNNFQVECNKTHELNVIIDNKEKLNWILILKNDKFVFASLKELLNKLNNCRHE